MKNPLQTSGITEMRAALAASWSAVVSIGLFSFFVNILAFTGPLFMLQVYDRVLGSGSEETLVMLSVLMLGLYIIQGILDHVRARMAARIGARFQAGLEERTFRIALDRVTLNARGIETTSAMRDLDSIQRALSSPAVFSLFDIFSTPVFILVIFVFHPLMGWLAVGGALVLTILAWLNHHGTRRDQENAVEATRLSEEMTAILQQESDTVRAIGVRRFATERWKTLRDNALAANMHYSDLNGFYSTTSKTFRIFLQSAILALGAWLVLRHDITGGSMIACSILIGRGLAPIESLIGNWAVLQKATQGWKRLRTLLQQVPQEPLRTALPRPKALLFVEQIVAGPPGERLATLRNISFQVLPGQALGVIGASGSGKTTLARVLTGVWPVASGKVRLDGAALDHYGVDVLPDHVGYLPQEVVLFSGTIAENIARLDPAPDSHKVVAAAKKAAAHELILSLPDGYETRIANVGSRLSGGQKQRIGLARALYGDPSLLVLDEPNSNLDAEGSMALNAAIRGLKAEGRSVVIMAHRPAAIEECDTILLLEKGQRLAFGPRDDVLRAHLRNISPMPAAAPPLDRVG